MKKVKMNKELRRIILERDDFTCRKCKKKDFNKILHIHHLDCDPFNNKENNLVTLCIKCHHFLHSMLWNSYKEKLRLNKLNCGIEVESC
ncbi:MAG: hypothetical protein AABW67_04305 [Nanoarchaeota archaeon]